MSLEELARDHDRLAGVRDRLEAAERLVERSLISLDEDELEEAIIELGLARGVLGAVKNNAASRRAREWSGRPAAQIVKDSFSE